jgi:hypothetical protein
LQKSLYIILGNGFSLDFLERIDKLSQVDVRNLFKHGANVPWLADKEPGFLSFKHCPNLWNLGARPNMNDTDAIALIEDVITCVNVFTSVPKSARLRTTTHYHKPNYIYIFAYQELVAYLKHLFIYYDQKTQLLPEQLVEWPWAKFLKKVNQSERYNRVIIVTYNYDIWLERLLLYLKIPFQMDLFEEPNPDVKITILKPHGSISFAHTVEIDQAAFTIAQTREIQDANISDLRVRYDNLAGNYPINALIPSAGESARIKHSWAGQIRARATKLAQSLRPDDEALICGLSYWHVDRAELDEILTRCDPLINLKMINPNPSRALDAVITSIFDNYICYNSADALEDHDL